MDISPITLVKIVLIAVVIGAIILFWTQYKFSKNVGPDGKSKNMTSLIPAVLEAFGVSRTDIKTLWGQPVGTVSNAATRISELRSTAEDRRLKSRSINSHSVSNECAIADMDTDAIEIRVPPPLLTNGDPLDDMDGGINDDVPEPNLDHDFEEDDLSEEDPSGFIRVEKSMDTVFEKEGQRLFEELVLLNGGMHEHVTHGVKLFIPSLPTNSIYVSSYFDNCNGTKIGVVFLPHYLSAFPNARHGSRSAYELDRERRSELLKFAKDGGVMIIDIPFSIHGGTKSATEKHKTLIYNHLHKVLENYWRESKYS